MKTLTEYLKFHTKTHRAYIHITPQIETAVSKSGVQEGMVLVSAMHITAGIYVNDHESGLIEDIDEWLAVLESVCREAYDDPETGRTAPHNQAIHRPDASHLDEPRGWATTWRAYRAKHAGS